VDNGSRKERLRTDNLTLRIAAYMNYTELHDEKIDVSYQDAAFTFRQFFFWRNRVDKLLLIMYYLLTQPEPSALLSTSPQTAGRKEEDEQYI
jgi:hypothetical protein